MSVATPVSGNASSSTVSPQVRAPALLPYLPNLPYSPHFNYPPEFVPVPSSSSVTATSTQNNTQNPISTLRTSSRPSYLSSSSTALTLRQTYYRTAPRAYLVGDLLTIGDPNGAGPFTKQSIASFKNEVKSARTSDNNPRDWAEVSSSFDRVDKFLKDMSGARDLLRMQSFASDPTLVPHIDTAVSACTNAVRSNLYRNTDYNKAWVSVTRLKEKAHSARNKATEKLREQAVIQDALARVDAFYRNPSNDDIAGAQITQPVEAGCLGDGRLNYGKLNQALQHGLRGGVTAGTGPDTPWLVGKSVFEGGNLVASNTFSARGWLATQVNYSWNSANAKSLVRGVSYREDGAEKDVLLAPNHYSIDDGRTWQVNPHFTSPAIERSKLRYTNALITKAKSDAGFYGCGPFFRIKAPPT
jgi:hypothetical protein